MSKKLILDELKKEINGEEKVIIKASVLNDLINQIEKQAREIKIQSFHEEQLKNYIEDMKKRHNKELKELKQDISNMYNAEVVYSIIEDEFNLTRSEVMELFGESED